GVRGQRGGDRLGAQRRYARGRDLGREPAGGRSRLSGSASRPSHRRHTRGHQRCISARGHVRAMIEDVEQSPRGPTLVLLPDPEARAGLRAPLLGIPLAARLASAAREAGFAEVIAAPGLVAAPPGVRELAIGELLPGPGLVVFEGTFVDPMLLRLMVEHPLESDERFSLYDGVARPAGFFAGSLGAMPAIMPVSEELDWPEGLGPDDIARVVYDEDVERAEWLVLRTEARRSRTSGWRGTETEHVHRSLAG